VGCNLAPLRGYFEALIPIANSSLELRHSLLRDLNRFFRLSQRLKRWAKLGRPFGFAQAGSSGLDRGVWWLSECSERPQILL